jgi:flagellar basal-body rod protein FlgB
MIQGMFNYGALPALERLVQFTSARHKVLTNNIANLSTPYFRPGDLDPRSFQSALADAIDQRRQSPAPVEGELNLSDTDQVTFTPGGIVANPQASNDGILYHDQNNRDLERIMQRLAENTLAHNGAIEMIRNQFSLLQTAIRERL